MTIPHVANPQLSDSKVTDSQASNPQPVSPETKGAFSYLTIPERRLAIQAVVVAVVVWAAVYLLRITVHATFHAIIEFVENSPTPLLLLIPIVIGAIIEAAVIWYRHTFVHYRDDKGRLHRLMDGEGDGLERAIALYYSSEPSLEQVLLGREGVDVRWQLPTLSLALRKWVATYFTLGTGRSGGLEGSAALLGESVAASMFKPRMIALTGFRRKVWEWWRVTTPDELQTLQVAGMAAAFSTLLGAPFGAGFFAIEVLYRRKPQLDKLLYALIASITAYFLNHWMEPQHTRLFVFPSQLAPAFDSRYLAALLITFIAIMAVTRIFAWVRSLIADSSKRFFTHIWMRHATGAIGTAMVAIALVWLVDAPLDLVLGTGQSTIEQALTGGMVLPILFAALIGKLLATSFTVGMGGSSGLLLPAIYLGAMCGAIVANLLDFLPEQIIAPAVTASLVATINVPLAAMLLTLELFGSSYILPAVLALIVILLLGRNVTIYRTQREREASRELLPGYEVRRIAVPPEWDAETLGTLQLRRRFNLNVIGKVIEEGDGHTSVRPDLPSHQPLKQGETLIVLGKSEEFNRLALDLDEQIEHEDSNYGSSNREGANRESAGHGADEGEWSQIDE